MSDLEDQIAKLIAEAERRAFERGFKMAIDVLKSAATQNFDSASADAVSPANGHAKPAIARVRLSKGNMALVLNVISDKPGLKGVEVVRELAARGTPVTERTVRTCLRRLREAKSIWQRKHKWYSKNANPTEEVADTHLL